MFTFPLWTLIWFRRSSVYCFFFIPAPPSLSSQHQQYVYIARLLSTNKNVIAQPIKQCCKAQKSKTKTFSVTLTCWKWIFSAFIFDFIVCTTRWHKCLASERCSRFGCQSKNKAEQGNKCFRKFQVFVQNCLSARKNKFSMTLSLYCIDRFAHSNIRNCPLYEHNETFTFASQR